MIFVFQTFEFSEWYKAESPKVRAQIDARLERIKVSKHLGHVRRLSAVLFELKFNNGNRIYYTEKTINGRTLILILGGNKHGQDKDIIRAEKIARQIHGD